MSIMGAFMVPHPPIIIEEIGHRREKGIEPIINAYAEVANLIFELQPETIVFISPHSTSYSDYFHISGGLTAKGNFGEFGHPELGFQKEIDQSFVSMLHQYCQEHYFPAGTLGEKNAVLDHGIMVPLYFFEQKYKTFQIVMISVTNESYETHYRMGEIIQEVSKQLDKKIVVVASGDLSHKVNDHSPYGFHFSGPRYDEKIMEIMEHMEFQDLFDFSKEFCESAAECGHRPFVCLAGSLNKKELTCPLTAYASPYGVGYGICAYLVTDDNVKRNLMDRSKNIHELEVRHLETKTVVDEYVNLARSSLHYFLLTHKRLPVKETFLEEMLKSKAGVFVSIKKRGVLRGCIGTIEARQNSIAEEVIENAIQAGISDPRFPPVKPHELDELEFSVDILQPAETIDTISMLDHKKFGLIVHNEKKRGVLLPNLEGIQSVYEQLELALKKAGIEEHEEYQMERFLVERHSS